MTFVIELRKRRIDLVRLSPRDQTVLSLLARYEVMSSQQIRKRAFGNTPQTNCFRRMRQLEKAKMIRRMGPMTDHSYAWVLGAAGKSRMGFDERDLINARFTLEHDVSMTRVRISATGGMPTRAARAPSRT